jgi:glycosyltransferase involved in cell wall biosynthesis
MALVWPYTNARFCWCNQQDEGRDLHGTNVEKKILRRVSTITSNSTAGRDFLAQTYDLNASSIHVYNNGTPLLPLRTNGRGAQSRPRRKVVTMVANITRYKDHRTLIDAWGILRREMPAAAFPRLLLAGNLRDCNTVADLKAHAFDIGLSSEDVTFLGAVDDVPSLLQRSDLLVHSSLTEGCPNSVCEAMSAGLAVVATDIPGCRQALGETGLRWLVEPKNPGDLASRVRELLSDDQLRTEVGLQNRARIARDFSIDGMNRFFQEQIEAGLETSLS